MKCIVCHRQAKGYGWFNTRRKRGDPQRYSDQWVFCSRRCQESFSKLMNKTEGQMIDPNEYETFDPTPAGTSTRVARMPNLLKTAEDAGGVSFSKPSLASALPSG